MIPTLLVSQLARRSVTVALSGDGGDELFGGYNRHLWAPKVWRATRRSPQFFRKGLASAIRSVSPATWDVVANLALRRVPARWQFRHMGEKLHKVASMVVHSRARDAYAALATAGDPSLVQVDTAAPDPWRSAATPEGLTFSEEMMLLDLVTYLPDDILTKVDRASMAVALEARVPLIDHRVVAFAWSLPAGYRIRNGVTKAPLRDLLARFVPARLLEHPKSGFGVPIGDWVRGPLRGWAEDLIEPKRLRNEGFLVEDRVASLWHDHVEGRANSTAALWAVLMFQAWLAGERSGTGP
jgi:asparagine synthase (glutamine-hydrolysing)